MYGRARAAYTIAVLFVLALTLLGRCDGEFSSQQPATPSQVIRSVGTIKAIDSGTIVLTPDTGAPLNVVVQTTTRIVRIPPGETTLKNATPVQLQDLQAGDRILVAGRLGEDSKSLNASTIVVMKRSDVAAKQEQDREDWQKRGLGGLVTAVDPAAGSVTISMPAPGGNKQEVTIHTTKKTVVRRYAPDSVKFEDARLATLAEIKPGDQLRARGARSADGSELDADEIVSGTFRNLAGTVISTDPSANTVTILNLATKKPIMVKVTPESQLRKLPAETAQRIAMRFKGGGTGGAGGKNAPAGSGATTASRSQGSAGEIAEHPHMTGSLDLQRMISRMPVLSVGELQKGDAVMIVSTEGTASGGVTAITLLSGVEPILQSSKGGEGMILSPWSLGGEGGETENQ